MFGLTIGRRLALVVAVALTVVTVLALSVLNNRSEDALTRTSEQHNSIALPLATLIENELTNAGVLLEVAGAAVDDARQQAATLGVDDQSSPGGGNTADVAEPGSDAAEAAERTTIARLIESGFLSAEILDDAQSPSRLDATSNFITRASTATSIGATQATNEDDIAVLIATPLQDGRVLIGAYDIAGILVGLSAAESGESTEALLAARNAQGDTIIFSPSRHNGGEAIGAPDRETVEIFEQTFTEDSVDLEGVDFNGRDSVVTLTRIPGVEWVLSVATDFDEARGPRLPIWLIPAFVLIGFASLIPIAVIRTRLRNVVRGAQELNRDRLATPLDDHTDDEIGVLSRTLQSLDERLQVESERRSRNAATLQHRATHDPLTGVANRGKLVEELTLALDEREQVAILFCDIDDFKGINDSQGHEGGDIVLKFVANQLASVCGPTELIARFGGDEFCVLTRTDAQSARALASRVERALDATCVVNNNQVRIGGSVGLAIVKRTDTPDSILKTADLAMYREKERRRGLRQAAGGGRSGEIEVSVEQIRLVYQPVVDISDGSIIGVEVLARYNHPVLGLLDPSSFLPPGTEQGMFDKFDLEILTRSIGQLSEWLDHGVVDERFTLSFNLKPDHVSDSDSTRKIFEILRQNRVPATMLQIEVTEHRLHAHADDLVLSLNRLRERGIKIAIDDFGVEGSNVDRLVQIPSDTVKIDRSFVSEIDTDERAEARLKAILEIVATESLVPIAEGVERTSQVEVLRDLGVQYGQGFFWHAPISALALTPLLGRASRWTRRRSSRVADVK